MRRIRKRLLRHRYLVTLDNGDAFTGVLLDADAEFFVLTQVHMIGPDSELVPVDGELVLPRARVLYAQKGG